MSLDFNKYGAELQSAYNDVFNEKKDTNWAVFGYEGQTNVLKVTDTGSDGLEEAVDELSGGKIQYCFCRVIDNNSKLPKFVLINWQGEGVPERRKGMCASHIRDVERFFHSAHVKITARTDADIDPDAIMDKVAKSSGANYNQHKNNFTEVPESGPVGSVYKKTQPHREINPQRRDDFWETTQREENQRKQDQMQSKIEQNRKFEEERKAREVRETAEREKRVREREMEVGRQRALERRASEQEQDQQEKKLWEETEAEAQRDSEKKRRASETERKARLAEANSLVQQRAANPRDVFENKRSQFNEPPKSGPGKLKSPFLAQSSAPPPPAARKAPITLPKAKEQPDDVFETPSRPAAALSQKPAPPREPTPPPREPTPPPREPTPPPREPTPPPREPTPPPREPTPPLRESNPPAPVQAPTATRNMLATGVPRRPASDSEHEDDDAWDDDESSVPAAPATYSAPQQTIPQQEPEQEQTSGGNFQKLSEHGVCARAIYDYQAEDDTEITFDPDDVITNIEKIDPGWWTGTCNGASGMFPANYVEEF